MNLLIWIGILVCLSQSAILSGLNLALFSLSKLELRVEAKKGDPAAGKALRFREDANFALSTILWGNVAVNVLLTLLSGSVLAGVAAFLFSTVVITVFAEILPQAYFSRHALRVAGALSPVLRAYQALLYPVARPTAWALDALLGGEGVRYFSEPDLRQLIRLHMDSASTDIARLEGQGALNFLNIDDVPLGDEGEPLSPESVIPLEFEGDRPVFPPVSSDPQDAFLRKLNRSGRSWAILVDAAGEPRLALKVDDFIREAVFEPERFDPRRHCHRPIVVRDAGEKLGQLIPRFRLPTGGHGEDIVDNDVILLWSQAPRIVTASDIFGRLMRGIARPL